MKRPRHERIVSVRMALDLDATTARILDGQSRIANWLWNDLLETANDHREKLLSSPRSTGDATVAGDATASSNVPNNHLTHLYSRYAIRDAMVERKETAPWTKTLHSSVSKNVALRLTKAIKDTRKSGVGARSKPLSWPVYKRWADQWFSLEYDEPNKGFVRDGRDLALSLGKDVSGKRLRVTVRLHESPPDFMKPANTRALRITREHGIYYAIFTVKRMIVDQKPLLLPGTDGSMNSAGGSTSAPRIAAIDPGHRTVLTVVGNDGVSTKVPKPAYLIDLDRRIDETKSRRDHCVRKSVYHTEGDGRPYYTPSRRWRFYNEKLNKLYALRREQTKTHVYSVLNKLYQQYDIIAFGDYAPRGGGRSTGERRSMNGRSLIGAFKRDGAWLAERSGKRFIIWDERGSTRTCNACGTVVKEGLSPDIRTWTCQNLACRSLNDRDENAAKNGLDKVLATITQDQRSMPCSGHREILSRRTWSLTARGITEVIHTPEPLTMVLPL